MYKQIYKKPFKPIKPLIATALAGLTVGGYLLCATSFHINNLSSDAQINSMVQALNCNTYMLSTNQQNQPCRLQNNGNDPIYISISSAFSTQQHDLIVEALDNVFDILTIINPKYTYQELPESDLALKNFLGCATIEIHVNNNLADKYGAIANVSYGFSFLDFLTATNDQSHGHIGIDVNYCKRDDVSTTMFVGCIMHELCHCLGMRDIYNYDKTTREVIFNFGNHYTTIMDPSYISRLCLLSPSDFKLLACLYAPAFRSAEEKIIYTAKIKKKIEEYEIFYYSAFIENFIQDQSIEYFNTYTKPPHKFSVSWEYCSNKLTEKQLYHLTVNNTRYTFSIMDKNGYVVDSVTGEVFNGENYIILKDLKLQRGLFPNTEEMSKYNGTNEPVFLTVKNNNCFMFHTANNCMFNLNINSFETITEDEMIR